MRAAALLVVLLAGCQYPVAMKYPEARLAGKAASLGGCSLGVTFAGNPRRHAFGADDQRRDYASGVKKSEIMDEAGFDAADGGTREVALCRCMRYDVSASVQAREANEMLRSSVRELAQAAPQPVDWRHGTPMGSVARYEFALRNGERVHAAVNFSDNCVGIVAAIGGSEAAAKRFVDSRTALQ
jgi:hypothetical protein